MCLAPSAFDPTQGFTITNNTPQNIYIQSGANNFDVVAAGQVSGAYTNYGNYPVRNNNNANAAIYLTVVVAAADSSVNINSGTLRGHFIITTSFV
jgi:hypothetical protein